MAPPLIALGAFLLAKKAIVIALFKMGSAYGWPRIYRRCLEWNKSITRPTSQKHVRNAIASGFRLPGKCASLLKDPHVQNLLSTAADSSAAKSVFLAPGVSLSSLLRALKVMPDSMVGNFAEIIAKGAESKAGKESHLK